MAKAGFINEPQLPWVDHGEDRGFRILVIALLVLFMTDRSQVSAVEKLFQVDVTFV